MNMYVKSNPLTNNDPYGLWGANETRQRERDEWERAREARRIIYADEPVRWPGGFKVSFHVYNTYTKSIEFTKTVSYDFQSLDRQILVMARNDFVRRAVEQSNNIVAYKALKLTILEITKNGNSSNANEMIKKALDASTKDLARLDQQRATAQEGVQNAAQSLASNIKQINVVHANLISTVAANNAGNIGSTIVSLALTPFTVAGAVLDVSLLVTDVTFAIQNAVNNVSGTQKEALEGLLKNILDAQDKFSTNIQILLQNKYATERQKYIHRFLSEADKMQDKRPYLLAVVGLLDLNIQYNEIVIQTNDLTVEILNNPDPQVGIEYLNEHETAYLEAKRMEIVKTRVEEELRFW